jgi:GrpB-like predicted nucleotidyltransferase (UPF0157 family)
MPDPIVVVPYNSNWKNEFKEIGSKIRSSLGPMAVRIDHIGSTGVEGLDAKPIIDIQVSVASLEPMALYKGILEQIGFLHRADNPDLTKRYFRESSGNRRVHVHVREQGSWSEQFALLFRDYLRSHSEDCLRYANEKYKLMERYRDEREKYVEGKSPIIWAIIEKASKWSQEIGWKPGNTDA